MTGDLIVAFPAFRMQSLPLRYVERPAKVEAARHRGRTAMIVGVGNVEVAMAIEAARMTEHGHQFGEGVDGGCMQHQLAKR